MRFEHLALIAGSFCGAQSTSYLVNAHHQVVGLHIQGKSGSIPPNDRLKSHIEAINPIASEETEFIHNPPIRPLDLENLYISYTLDLNIGTPPQLAAIAIDTGSSDLWIISKDNSFCAKDISDIQKGWPDCSANVFDAEKSSTWKDNGTFFHIAYGDYTYAIGKWGTDKLTLGDSDIKLEEANFAIGQKSNSSQGVFGIGYTEDEAALFKYKNIPILLKEAGYINSVSYSLYLNDADAKSGEILFGGVDHDKYQGTLYTIPIIAPDGGKPSKMIADLTEVTYTDGQGKKSVVGKNIQPLLDSGTTLTILPSNTVKSIYSSIGARVIDGAPLYGVPCSLRYSNKFLEYNFSGAIIKVPFGEILLDIEGDNGQPFFMESGELACGVGIVPSDDTMILGDTFLRSAYVVYDLENNEISIANTKFNSTSSSIEPITTSGVPGAIRAPSIH